MRHQALHRVLLGLCLALPWLIPFTRPPSAAVWPLLCSWMCAAVALMLVADAASVSMPWPRGARRVAIGMLALVTVSVLCVPAVVDRALTLGLLAALLTVAASAVVAYRAERSAGWAGAIVAAWLLAAVLSSVIGVLQYFGWAAWAGGWINVPPEGVAYANLRQRNQFASLTALGLVSLYGACLWCWAQHRMLSRRVQVLAWSGLLVLSAGAAVASSRTGLVAWLAVPFLLALWCRRALRVSAADAVALHGLRSVQWMVWAAPLLLLLWSWLMPWLHWASTGDWGGGLFSRIGAEWADQGSCASRRVMWDNVLTMIAQHPWVGWGWGETDYAQFMTRIVGPRSCELIDNAHNLVLQLMLDIGVPLALALLGLAVHWVWRRRPWADNAPRRLLAWGVLCVLLIHSLLEYPLWYGPFQIAFGLALGCLWQAPGDLLLVDDAAMSTRASPWRPMAVGALCFAACLYAAWDYHRIGQIYLPVQARDAAYRDDPWTAARASWLFRNPVEFATLTVQQVTSDNASELYPLALRVMHYSPEKSVVERAILAARQLGLDQAALLLADRLQAAETARAAAADTDTRPRDPD